MSPKEKRAFIRNLTRSVAAHVTAAVPKMPAEWDGHELRHLLAEQFAAEAAGKFTPSSPRRNFLALSGRRLRSYRNERLVRNIP